MNHKLFVAIVLIAHTCFLHGAEPPVIDSDEPSALHCILAAARTINDVQTLLSDAVVEGDVEQVTLLLAQSTDVNIPGKRGFPLVVAANRGDINMVDCLLKACGVHVDAKSSRYPETAIVYAVRADYEEIVQALVKAGADLTQCNEVGDSLLFKAARSGNHKITSWLIQQLVQKGLPVDSNALHGAAYKGKPLILQELLTARANVDCIRKGISPLLQAAAEDHDECVTLLLAAQATVDLPRESDGATPLYVAVDCRHKAVVTLLVEGKADVNVVVRGETMCDMAQRSNTYISQYIKKHGAQCWVSQKDRADYS